MFNNYVSIYKIMENIYVSQIIDDIRIYRLWAAERYLPNHMHAKSAYNQRHYKLKQAQVK